MRELPNAVPAGEFKAKCLQLMRQVEQTHRSIIITKRGVPVAKLTPFEVETPKLFGALQGSVTINGDIVSPIDEKWDADE